MKLDTIHHVAIIVSDYERSKEFYVNKLGFEVIRENYRPGRDDWKLDLRLNDSTELELFAIKNAPARPSYPEAQGLRHLAFKVDSVPEALEWLHSRGIKTSDLMPIPYTENEFVAFFWDPDGTPLELHE